MRLRRLPHYLYLADLIEGAKVLVVGCGPGDGANFLANHGALRVVGIDEAVSSITEARARHRLTNLEFRRELLDSIELEDAHFDAVFVPDGVSILRRVAVLRELRRVLDPRGHLVLSAMSADRPTASGGASFHELINRLEPMFEPVRMVAQSPFVGMSLVEYADDDAVGLMLDTSLLAGQHTTEVTEYVAIAGGPSDAVPRGFTVVQLPVAEGLEALAATRSSGRSRFETDVEMTAPATPSALDGLDEELDTLRFERDKLAATIETVTIEKRRAEEEITTLRARMRKQVEAAAPSATELVAAGLAAHQTLAAELEAKILEQQARIDELCDDVGRAERAASESERARDAAQERSSQVWEDLKQWRDRASVAEGRLLALESDDGAAPAEPTPVDHSAAVSAADDAAATLLSVKRQLERTEQQHHALAGSEATERLMSLEAALEAERNLLSQIEEGLGAMRRQAAEAGDQAPSAWAAQREEQLRDLAGELGSKDAEIAILGVGITSLRDRVKHVLSELRDARRCLDGQSAPEVASVLDRLAAKLSAYEEQD